MWWISSAKSWITDASSLCYSNYAVSSVPDELLISATDEFGIIKSIEHKEYKIFGQMWHGEREAPFNKEESNLVQDFFND